MPPTILVVDDDATLRCLLAIALDAGYRVEEAHDGIQVLAPLGRCAPDLILRGLRMPRLDGIGLA